MIPVRLQVRNFLCYRDNVPALDFAGIHVACLSGANGHGKSALLDAMTWALWGKARARQDDALIHQGQTDMQVEMDFVMDDHLYRIIRKRSAKGRGQGALELQVEDGGEFRVLTEETMRATQARINGILRMDYDTFINSAFLVQGRADEFTVKSPADRKQVLADILGLALYDRAEEIAKDKAREADQRIAELNAQLREIERELVNLPAYRDEEKTLIADADKLKAQREEAQKHMQRAQAGLDELRARQRELSELDARRVQDAHLLENRNEKKSALLARAGELDALLREADGIEGGHRRLLDTRQAEADMGQKAIEAGELAAQTVKLEGTIAQARHRIELELQHAQKQARELAANAAQADSLRIQHAQVLAELASLDEKERERDDVRRAIQEAGLEAERLRAENAQLLKDMNELKGKIDQLSAAGAECPLCRSPLSEDNRARLLDEMTAEGHAKKAAYAANKERIQSLESRLDAQSKEMVGLDAALRGRAPTQKREAALAQALAQAEKAAEDAKRLDGEATALQGRLERHEYTQDEQARLVETQALQQAMGYDAAKHAALRQAVAELSRYETDLARLSSAREQAPVIQSDLEHLHEEIKQLQKSLDESAGRRAALESELATLPQAEEDFAKSKADAEMAAENERHARDRLAAARQKLAYCDALAAQKREKGTALSAAQGDKGIYDELRLAFGKKGIQAMIIESVIPEIQDEANALLDRMTDGKMQVTMQTQRDTKSGSTVETLDIHIADELGSRPYEMFSGGEAFRVNFAIRIALSKLLARRAGAQLRTLIMDEGFGSQDAAGRQKLVDAIQSVQDDFAKILVITHVEELQDAFPVRIHVEKTAEGSTFSIV
jgi:exonuclease SbcC